jgi:hypothetical protein
VFALSSLPVGGLLERCIQKCWLGCSSVMQWFVIICETVRFLRRLLAQISMTAHSVDVPARNPTSTANFVSAEEWHRCGEIRLESRGK